MSITVTKVEKHGCEHIVDAGIMDGKSLRDIAKECAEHSKAAFSHNNIMKYIELRHDTKQQEKKEVIVQDRRRVLKLVNQELDIIQLQYDTTETLLNRFKLIDDLPDMFREQMLAAIAGMEKNEDTSDELIAFLRGWVTSVEKELKRKVYELTSLNRELRENSKFLAEIRAKAFSFSLVQEYLALFMQKFKDESTDGAFERTLQWISANPRMQQIVDQQRAILDQ
jgi:hypothetical protein